MILIINYQASNLNSIINILKNQILNINFRKREDFDECEKLILPGVSNFAYCGKLISKNYDKFIKNK